jgi:hypothetical protein
MCLLAPLKSRASIAALICALFGTLGTRAFARPQIGGGFVGGVEVLQGGGPANVGSPYCATRKTETVQTLSNGAHITRKSESRECRDAQGRLRHESFLPNAPDEQSGTPTFINIFDPVEQVAYWLETGSHIARRMPFHPMVPPKPPNPSIPPKPAPSTPNGPLGPQMTAEPLESQTIEGLLVDGKRITTTFPAGFQGSDAPITTVEERWTSKELGGVVVLLKRSDPRNGDTTEQLTDIDRSEPDPSLFAVPADYTIKENESPR